MNNVTPIALRSASWCTRSPAWPQPSQVIRKALTAISSNQVVLSTSNRRVFLPVWQKPHGQICRASSPRTFATTRSSLFRASSVSRRLKPYDAKEEPGLTFRKRSLTHAEIRGIFGGSHPQYEVAERLLKVLHARRIDGTLDLPLDPELTATLENYPNAERDALRWLNVAFPVDEDDAILSRFHREEDAREQEHPSVLMERGQRLGLIQPQEESKQEMPEYYGPQSGRYYANLSDKEGDVFGKSQLEQIRARNEAEAEEEERKLQERIDQSMEAAQAKATARSQALQTRPEQFLELSDKEGHARPPNEFEKWIIRARERAQSQLTLESPEVVNMTMAGRLLPSLLVVLGGCFALYVLTQYWESPRRSERMFPEVSLAVATCGAIVAINVAVFIAWRFPPAWKVLNKIGEVVPAYPYALSMVGNLFSQSAGKHLLWNMTALLVFGPSLHEEVGRAHFLAIYLASGLAGGFVSLSSYVLKGVLSTSSKGASGCIMGIVGAYFTLHNDDNFSFIFIPSEYKDTFQAKGWMFLVAWALLDVSSAFRRTGIDVVAHLSGMAVGIIYAAYWRLSGNEAKKHNKPGIFGTRGS